MPSPTESQLPLAVTPAMWVTILVVAAVLWLGSSLHPDDLYEGQQRDTFDSWNLPRIEPIRSPANVDQSARFDEFGLQIAAVPGFDRFSIDFPGDRRGTTAIALIDRRRAVLARIVAFDPQTDPWPLQTTNRALTFIHSDDHDQRRDPLYLDDAWNLQRDDQAAGLLTETVEYANATITWQCQRKCPAWPLRIHVGKCELGSQTLHVFVYEMQANSLIPDYQTGPIADLAGSLAPL